MRRSTLVFALALFVASCGIPADPAGVGTATSTTSAVTGSSDTEQGDDSAPEGASPSQGSSVTGEVPEEILGPILADASQRFGAAVTDLVVVRAEAVIWPDGSLGCPEPGVFYTQATVEGFWVVLSHDAVELDYRTTERGSWRLCEQPAATPPSG